MLPACHPQLAALFSLAFGAHLFDLAQADGQSKAKEPAQRRKENNAQATTKKNNKPWVKLKDGARHLRRRT